MKFEIFTPIVIHELGQRANQEDSVYPQLGTAADTNRLFLVCDGMGGHEKGEVASANVINVMSTWIEQRTPHNGIVSDALIEEALQHAYQRLDSLDNGAENKMGTTLTLVSIHRGGVAMAHLGDSRIYHVRPSERKILYKSIDHSLVYDLYRSGAITYDEMATSPQRNVITRAIMPGEDNKDQIDIAHTTNVKPGDFFYLCSDGMLEEMTDDQLLNVLCQEGSDVMKASTLVSMTADNKDNHTALLIKIKSVVAEPGDEILPNDEDVSSYNEMVSITPVVSVVDEDNAVTQPMEPEHAMPPHYEGKPKAAASQAQAAKQQPVAHQCSNAAPASRGKSGGVNKTLLALVIVLLLVVAGGAAYFLLNKDKGGHANGGDSDSPNTEASTNVNNSVESSDNATQSTQSSNAVSQEGHSANTTSAGNSTQHSNSTQGHKGSNETATHQPAPKPVEDKPTDNKVQENKPNPPVPGGDDAVKPRPSINGKKVEDVLRGPRSTATNKNDS